MLACSHLLGNISRLPLEVFEGLHHGVVVQNGALHGADGVQKTLLQLTELSRQDINQKTKMGEKTETANPLICTRTRLDNTHRERAWRVDVGLRRHTPPNK